MKVAFSTRAITPHQTGVFSPFSRLAELTYFYHSVKFGAERIACGWTGDAADAVGMKTVFVPNRTVPELEDAPILIEGMRDLDLIERRLAKGLPTVYLSERWFKPFGFGLFGRRVNLPGTLRLLFPRYFRMARRMARCFRDPNFWYLPQGVWAAHDLVRVCAFFGGRPAALFRPLKLTFDPAPCGRIVSPDPVREGTARMRLWGYFVPPTAGGARAPSAGRPVKVLWVGRMIGWKRVETIVRAVRRARAGGADVTLTLVGEGVGRARLERCARGLPVTFLGYQRADRVRALMRAHDVYVLASDGGEGWGAALNEALEEGMCVYGTHEAGASATVLPKENRYAAGNARELAALLTRPPAVGRIGGWSGRRAARALLGFLERDVRHGR